MEAINTDIIDRRSEPTHQPISAELAKEGKSQLEAEIKIIEGWLKDLEETRDDNPESILAKSTYVDMLLNRKELLSTIKEK